MNYSNSYANGLEYLVGSSYSYYSSAKINYFSRFTDDNYHFAREEINFVYRGKARQMQYHKNKPYHEAIYAASHPFTPELFLKPSRPRARFVVDNNEAGRIAGEVFELMAREKLPDSISISVLPFDEFRLLHSMFGSWSSGILGFSLNGEEKRIFARENHLDALMLVIGHEIGHVLTETLPNKHDEEAKAFAFSVEWANTIKQHDVANLGSSIKDDFEPARNGLHDVAFQFVEFMLKKGRNAMQLHDDLARHYLSVFDKAY